MMNFIEWNLPDLNSEKLTHFRQQTRFLMIRVEIKNLFGFTFAYLVNESVCLKK